jgi:hypothetical protein
MIDNVEYGAVGGMGGKGNCLSAALSTTNPIWSDLGSNPDRRDGKPVTDYLKYNTVLDLAVSSIHCPSSQPQLIRSTLMLFSHILCLQGDAPQEVYPLKLCMHYSILYRLHASLPYPPWFRYLEIAGRPPLWFSDQSSWLQIQSSGWVHLRSYLQQKIAAPV